MLRINTLVGQLKELIEVKIPKVLFIVWNVAKLTKNGIINKFIYQHVVTNQHFLAKFVIRYVLHFMICIFKKVFTIIFQFINYPSVRIPARDDPPASHLEEG